MEPDKEKSVFRPLKRKSCDNGSKTQDDNPNRFHISTTNLPINAHPSPISPHAALLPHLEMFPGSSEMPLANISLIFSAANELIRKHEEMYCTIATQKETIKVLTDQRNRDMETIKMQKQTQDEIALLSRVLSELDKKMEKTIKEAGTNVTNKLEKTIEESSNNIRDFILTSNQTLFGFHYMTINNFGSISNQVASVEQCLEGIKNNQQQIEKIVDATKIETKEIIEGVKKKLLKNEDSICSDSTISCWQKQVDNLQKSVFQEMKSLYESSLSEKDREIALLKNRLETEQETFKTELANQQSINLSISEDNTVKQTKIDHLKKVIDTARSLLGPRANLLGKNPAD